jgi:hypothetical protein
MEQIHLGDGVYASFDGFQVWLAANHHLNKVIAIPEDVAENLIKYLKRAYNIKKDET